MCMFHSKNMSRVLRNKLAEKGYLYFYKAYHLRGNNLYSMVKQTRKPVNHGWIISTRKEQKVGADLDSNTSWTRIPQYNVYRGIHVVTSEKACRDDWDNGLKKPITVIVKVKCLLSDFVGAGAGRDRDAVFMKVHLSKREYDRVTKIPKTKKTKK